MGAQLPCPHLSLHQLKRRPVWFLAPSLTCWYRNVWCTQNARHFASLTFFIFATSTSPDGLTARVGSRYPIFLPDFDEAAALAYADELRTAFERPLQALGFGCELSIHIGMALAPQHGDTYRLLLRKSDVALYQTQELGAAVGIYDAARDPHTPERLCLLTELRGAIGRGELQLYCQPKVDMRTGTLAGAEALVRWHHPHHGIIGPGSFVPLVETTDLMMVLTEHMLHVSARQGAAWLADGLDIPLAVNLSTRDISTLRLSTVLPIILQAEGVSSSALGLEVTESSLLHNPQGSIAELQRLRALGFELYIDDFGTGFSSLSYLADLPVQVLKIDYGFTSRMMHDRRAASIVRATIRLAHELGLGVVAEGTADRVTWDALRSLGCDVAQGYYVAEPFATHKMQDWLAASPYTLPPS
jgi:EAL domain-containing protein (putative c-di-GMP-specific phosphodiesterase class I)